MEPLEILLHCPEPKMLLWEHVLCGLGTVQQVSPQLGRGVLRPIQSHLSGATLASQSPADAEIPQTRGQEGGHEYSGPGRWTILQKLIGWQRACYTEGS